ncbi:hypothetical protein EfmJHP38_30290 (plasmid) [Enterococcus faecium]|nr:hypothetical protein EfmJHP38_30290 [Enterococcus faecium]
MPEFVNTPNFYQDSDILSKINLPKEESALQVQRTLQETQKIQKSKKECLVDIFFSN